MASPFDDPAAEFRVLRNAAGEYSLWPTFHEIPAGWVAVGPTGSREVCSRWVDECGEAGSAAKRRDSEDVNQ